METKKLALPLLLAFLVLSLVTIAPPFVELVQASGHFYAVSGSASDIQDAVDDAENAGGGTVHVPAGTFYWSAGDTVTYTGSVDINITGASQAGCKSHEYDWADYTATTIIHNNAVPPKSGRMFYFGGQGHSPLVYGSVTVSNIQFEATPPPTTTAESEGYYDAIRMQQIPDFHISSCSFIDFCSEAVYVTAKDTGQASVNISCYGVIDHCRFTQPYKTTTPSPGSEWFWGYGIHVIGIDYEFSEQDPWWDETATDFWGQYGFRRWASIVYIEDCHFEYFRHGTVSRGNGYYVSRFNLFDKPACGYSAAACDLHGPAWPSGRGGEYYNNTFYGAEENNQPWYPYDSYYSLAIAPRGGHNLVFNNTFTCDTYSSFNCFITLTNDKYEGREYQYLNYTYIWDNTFTGCSFLDNDDPAFIHENIEYFLREPTLEDDGFTYAPLAYPHWLVGEKEEEEEENSVTLNAPSDDSTVYSLTVNFNYTPTFYQTIQNASLWTNETSWSLKEGNTTAIVNNTLNTITETFSGEGTYLWNFEVFNSTHSVFATANWTVTISIEEEEQNNVTLNQPANEATLNYLNVQFNYTATFYQGSIVNSSLWLFIEGLWQRVGWNTTSITNGTMHTISYTFSTYQIYLWNIEVFNSTTSHFSETNYTVTISTVTITTVTNPYATQASFQTKSFPAVGRYWVFYANYTTNQLVFKTSTDAETWSTETNIHSGDYGCHISVYFDGTYVHYAVTGYGTSLYYRRGIPESDGTISWSATEQTVTTTYNAASNPNICVDTNGYAWIGYREYTGGVRLPFVIKSGWNNGSWGTTPAGFPYQLSTVTYQTSAVSPVALTNGKVAAVYTAHNYSTAYGDLIHIQVWNGTDWLAEANSTSGSYHSMFHSAVAESDYVHITFMNYSSGNPLDILYVKYTYATNSFGTEVNLQSGIPQLDDGTDYCAPVISRTQDNRLFVFWGFYPTYAHIYYREWNGTTWEQRVDWIDETSYGFQDDHTWSAWRTSFNSEIGILYLTKDSSPYNVKFAILDTYEEQIYKITGLLYSINILNAKTVLLIEAFTYTASSIPSGTTLDIQFSQDNATWVNSTGQSAWQSLEEGSHQIDLTALSWNGSNFYYRCAFNSTTGNETPKLDYASVKYKTPGLSVVVQTSFQTSPTQMFSLAWNVLIQSAFNIGASLSTAFSWLVDAVRAVGGIFYTVDLVQAFTTSWMVLTQSIFSLDLSQALSTSWSVLISSSFITSLSQSFSTLWNVLVSWNTIINLNQALTTTWTVLIQSAFNLATTLSASFTWLVNVVYWEYSGVSYIVDLTLQIITQWTVKAVVIPIEISTATIGFVVVALAIALCALAIALKKREVKYEYE